MPNNSNLIHDHQERAARLEFAMLMLRIGTSAAFRAPTGSISTPQQR